MNFKKILLYVATVLVTFALVVFAMFIVKNIKVNKMMKQFDQAFEKKGKTMIYYASTTCHFCELEKPIIKQIKKDYNLKYVNIDAYYLSTKQKNKIIDQLDFDGGTPTTAIIENGKVKKIHVGYMDGYDYVEFLKEAGILPKDASYSKENKLNFIDAAEAYNMNDGILVLGMTASQNCTDLRSALNNIAKKYKIEINYLNLSHSTKEEYYSLYDKLLEMNINNYKIDEDDNLILPMIYVIKDNKVKKIINTIDETEIVTELKKIKVVK